jgi:Ubiquitin family.
METLTLNPSECILEFRTLNGTSMYGIYDTNATFGDALSAFFDNYNYRNRFINKYSFYSEYLKKYITELDLCKKISTYCMPQKSMIKLDYYKGSPWTIKDNNELVMKYESININIEIHKKNEKEQKTEYESNFKINVHCYLSIQILKENLYGKTMLLPNQYDLYYGDKLMTCENDIANYNVKNEDTILLIKKSKSKLERERIFSIKIKNDNKIIKCDVNSYSTIFEIKKEILEKGGILVSEQCLKYGDIELEDNESISKYDIKPGSILTLTIISGKYFSVTIKSLTGKITQLDISDNMLVYDIKYLIMKKEGVPIDCQRLIFSDIILSDECKVSKYNILPGNTLHYVMRLRGGMYHETSGRNGGFKLLEKIIFKIIPKSGK